MYKEQYFLPVTFFSHEYMTQDHIIPSFKAIFEVMVHNCIKFLTNIKQRIGQFYNILTYNYARQMQPLCIYVLIMQEIYRNKQIRKHWSLFWHGAYLKNQVSGSWVQVHDASSMSKKRKLHPQKKNKKKRVNSA